MPPKGWELRLDELQALSGAFNLLLPIPVLTNPKCWHVDVEENMSLSPAEILKTLDIGVGLRDTIKDLLESVMGSNNVPNIPEFVIEDILKMMESQAFMVEGKLYATGSRAEGLALPLHVGIDDNLCVTSFDESDLDLLVILRVELPVILSGLTPFLSSVTDASKWEIHQTQPGYFSYSGPALHFVTYISKFIASIGQVYGQIHGPAIETDIPMRQTDLVLAFEHLQWPKQAEEWRARPRLSGWPNIQLVKKIVEGGCHVVLKSHPFTDSTDEWRYSFSIAEKMLATSLTNVQKQCYFLVKTLYKQELKSLNPGGLTSYHIKTVFLWRVEEIPPSQWGTSQLSHHVLGICQQLYECLKEKSMSNYFIQSSNLIDYIREEEITVLLEILPKILENPLKYILGFWENNTLSVGPFTTSWEETKACFESITASKMPENLIDKAIEVSSRYIQDYPVVGKLASDILQFLVNYPDVEQTIELFHCFFQQQMIPLRVALSILKEPMRLCLNFKEDLDPNFRLSMDIFDCLTQIQDKSDVDAIRQMSAQEKYQALKLFFSGKGHVALHETALRLHAKLQEVKEQHLQIYDKFATPSVKATIAWSLLTRLVADTFIILNSPDQDAKYTQMTHLSTLVSQLSEMKYPPCLVQCGKQLEMHALLKMQNTDRVEELMHSLPANSKVQRLMARLKREVIQDKSLTEEQRVELKVGNMYLHPMYRLYHLSFECRPCTQISEADTIIETWMEMLEMIDLSTERNMTETRPVGAMHTDNNIPPLNCDDAMLYSFDKELASTFSLPERNMLWKVVQKRVTGKEETERPLHVSCRLVFSKYLIVIGKYAEASQILLDVLKCDSLCKQIYHVCPRMTVTLLDNATFSSHKEMRIDFVSMHMMVYASYLLVLSYVKMDSMDSARVTLNKMQETTKEMMEPENQPDTPWHVIANNLVLLGTAHAMCGNKVQGLAFIGLVALLHSKKGMSRLRIEIDAAFCTGDKTLLDVFSGSLDSLQEVAYGEEPYAPLDHLMRVYYPNQSLNNALSSFLYYTHDGSDYHKEALLSLVVC